MNNFRICPANRLSCPRCESPLYRTELLRGFLFAVCEAKVTRPGTAVGTRCNTHLFIATSEVLPSCETEGAQAFVSAISPSEKAHILERMDTARRGGGPRPPNPIAAPPARRLRRPDE